MSSVLAYGHESYDLLSSFSLRFCTLSVSALASDSARANLIRICGRPAMSTNETPAWFREALADVPVTHAMEYECGRVSYLRWGDRFDKGNKRALVLVHGTFAHAHCGFLTPYFSLDYLVSLGLIDTCASQGGTSSRQCLPTSLW